MPAAEPDYTIVCADAADREPTPDVTPRLKTALWVQAQVRRCDLELIPVVVARRGDPDAGSVLLKLLRRGPDEVPVSVFGAEAEAGEVERYVETGAARVVFNLPSAGADEVLPLLDLQADLIGRFREGDDRPG